MSARTTMAIAAAGFVEQQRPAREAARSRNRLASPAEQARAMLIIGASNEAEKINMPAPLLDVRPTIGCFEVAGKPDRRIVCLWSDRGRPLAIAVEQS